MSARENARRKEQDHGEAVAQLPNGDRLLGNGYETGAENVAQVSRALQRLSSLQEGAARPIGSTLPGGRQQIGDDAICMLRNMARTTYHWDYATDRLTWAATASDIIPNLKPGAICTGKSYERLIDPQHARARRLAILEARDATGSGLSPYRVEYRLYPGGYHPDRAIWIEEEGVWNALSDGDRARPEDRRNSATAILRVIDEPAPVAEKLHYLSRYDEMTGLLNRTYFTSVLSDCLAREAANGEPGKHALLLVSISNLHMINESFGYDIGDEMIVAVGTRLRENLRRGDVIGRYGSNKYAILLRNCNQAGMVASARRLIAAVEREHFSTSAGLVAGKISAGGVVIDRETATLEQVTSRALDALDQANARPLDRFVAFEPSLQRENMRRKNNSVASEVSAALVSGRVQFAMQPIVGADHLRPTHYECLVRIEREGGQIVAASQFMPVAERMGFARPLDRRVLDLVLDYARHRPETNLAFNVSGLTTMDYGWLEALEQGIANDRALAQRLMVEITETSAITDIDDTAAFVNAVKALGCRVAIDDFGAGYTSFRNLKMLDVDMLKIDASFIKDLYHSPEDQLFVRTMIGLAYNLGIETVAEGVRDQRTAELLRNMGITHLQGYYFGRPKLVTPYYDFIEREPDGQSPMAPERAMPEPRKSGNGPEHNPTSGRQLSGELCDKTIG